MSVAGRSLYTSAAMRDRTGNSETRGGEAQSGAPPRKVTGLAMWSWVLYDFSNTIFSVSILSYFFPLWFGNELGAGGGAYNYLATLAALLIVLTAPVLGAVADLRQSRRPYLILFTGVAVAFTAGLGFSGSVLVAAALFVVAQVSYQSALVVYYALLPRVSAGRGAGRVSGYGTAAGYIGAILALIVVTFFVSEQTLFGVTFGGPET